MNTNSQHNFSQHNRSQNKLSQPKLSQNKLSQPKLSQNKLSQIEHLLRTLERNIGKQKSFKTLYKVKDYIYNELKVFFNEIYELNESNNGVDKSKKFDNYLFNFLIGNIHNDFLLDDKHVDFKLSDYINNFFLQKKHIKENSKFNTILFYRMHSNYLKNNLNTNFEKKIVPKNVVLVLSTPVNRFSYSECKKEDSDYNFHKLLINKDKTHEGSLIYLLKNIQCVDKFKTNNNKNNSFNSNYKNMFQNAIILYPEQYYYDLNIVYSLQESSEYSGIYEDGKKIEKNPESPSSFKLSDYLKKISNDNVINKKISYVLPLGCRFIGETTEQSQNIYTDELFSYSINFLLSNCKKNIKSNIKSKYSKFIPHGININTNTIIKSRCTFEKKDNYTILSSVYEALYNYYTNFYTKFNKYIGNEKYDKFNDSLKQTIQKYSNYIQNKYEIINEMNKEKYEINFNEKGYIDFKNLLELIVTIFNNKLFIIKNDDYRFFEDNVNLEKLKFYVRDFYSCIYFFIMNNNETDYDLLIVNYNNFKKEICSIEKPNTILEIIVGNIQEGETFLTENKEVDINKIHNFLFNPLVIALFADSLYDSLLCIYDNMVNLYRGINTRQYSNAIKKLPRMGRSARHLLLTNRTKKYNTSTNA
jgi:hypothetical protein